jgi:hypothetical protein
MLRRLAWPLLAAVVSGQPPRGGPPAGSQAPRGDRVEAPGLHNVYRLSKKLLSGSSPEGDVGFASLQKLGVKTVLSVAGARPDVARARRHGLRYVHLPIGYDGVPRAQALRIARAVRDLPGPVYVHCHHGQHRGPAAAAVALLCLDPAWSPEAALAWMRRAGTDPRYVGLYAAPQELRRPSADELDRVPADFPEVAAVTGTAQVMVGIDERWENLKLVRAAGWKTPPGHPDVDPPHEAVQLVEYFREARRLPTTRARPEDFRRRLSEAEAAAKALEAALRGRPASPGGATAAEGAFRRVEAACARCHARFRDAPRKR